MTPIATRALLAPLAVAICLSCASVAPLAPLTPQEALQRSAPISYRLTPKGLFVIDVEIDGRGPYAMLLDTGASASGVYEHAVMRQRLSVNGAKMVTVRGLVGVSTRPVTDAQTISLADADHAIERLVVFKDRDGGGHVDGVLGMDVLSDYTLIVEPSSKTLGFMRHHAGPAASFQGWTRAPLHEGPIAGNGFGLHFVDMRIGPTLVPTLIDTGSEATIINEAAVANNLSYRMARRLTRGRQEFEGVNDRATRPIQGVWSGLAVGDHVWSDQTVIVLDMTSLAVLGDQGRPFAIAGADLLSTTAFALDFANDWMFFAPAQDAPQSVEERA